MRWWNSAVSILRHHEISALNSTERVVELKLVVDDPEIILELPLTLLETVLEVFKF